jgi:carbamoyltransferase
MDILGINAFHGDASAVLVRDGEFVAGVEEERLNRIKHWAGFPARAIGAVLEDAGSELGQVAHAAVSRDPRAHVLDKALFAFRRRPGLAAVKERLPRRPPSSARLSRRRRA